ncbi:ABC transporter substrate-binding protein [Gracilibacillus sp. YIM 98692]|uniref:ABC transporter substrate-binding protein n=1 Tax=Gracilibacillus sp. YIM 98692 TaxID=2663532 RepID=UPI0013D6666D|nr:ABC transporter substrate-binding protein [Gracilibacillus sp. YIM 98692]
MKKKIFGFMFLVVIILFISACSSESSQENIDSQASDDNQEASDEKVTLTTAVFAGDSEAADGWMTEIAEQIGVEIDIQVLPDGDQNQQLYKTKAATNSLPDLVLYHPGTKFKNDIVPEKNLVDLSEQKWVEKLSDTSPFSVDGKIYAAPMGGGMGVGIFYNKEVFNELGIETPETLDELVAIAEKIKSESDQVPFYVTGETPVGLESLGYAATAVDVAKNESLIEDINENKAKFTDAEYFIESHQMLEELYNKDLINSDVLSASLEHAVSAIAEGEAAMFLTADFITNILAASYSDEELNKLGHFAYPSDGEDVYAYKPGYALGVANTSEQQNKAKEFIDYFMTEEGQQIFLENNKGFKTPAFALESGTKSSNELFQSIAQTYADNTPVEMFDGIVVVNPGSWGPSVQQMLIGDTNPEEIAESIQATIEQNAEAAEIPEFTE